MASDDCFATSRPGSVSAVEYPLQCVHLVALEFRRLLGPMVLQVGIENFQDEGGFGIRWSGARYWVSRFPSTSSIARS